MDGVKGNHPMCSPRPSTVPDHSISGLRETNENEQPLEQKSVPKHFMSTTISASSKASVPRRKILFERNEIPSTFDTQKANLGSKTSSLHSASHHSGKLPVSSYTYASESDDDQQNNFTVESSYKPYDPLTNNLVPRPKYLRYKPNKRRGILLASKRRDSIDSQISDDEGPLQQAQDSSNPQEHNLKLESKEEDADTVEDDEEIEEDVEQGWSLKRVLKLLLLLLVFFLSVSFLSSPNSMVTSDTYNMIRRNIFEAVLSETYGSGSVDQLEYSQSGFLEFTQRKINYENIMEETTEPQKELGAETKYNTEVEITGIVHGDEEEETMSIAEDEVTSTNEMAEERADNMEKTTEPLKELGAETEINTEVENTQTVQGDEEEETMSIAEGEVTSPNEVDEENVEVFDMQLLMDQALEEKNTNLEELLDDLSSTFASGQFADSSGNVEQPEVDYKAEQVEDISLESAEEDELSEMEGAEEVNFQLVEDLGTEFETSYPDTDIEPENVEVYKIGHDNTVIIIGLSAASVLVASLVIIYVSKKSRPASIESPVIATAEGDLLKEKADTPVKVPSLQEPLDGPKKEASKEISQTTAPNVELLGEMVVEVSSTLRSCVNKNNMIERERSNTFFSEEEISLAHSTALPPDDDSSTDSPSYGSFIAEKKIFKKKVQKSGEEVKKVELVTPVRRSSRIRDRSPLN